MVRRRSARLSCDSVSRLAYASDIENCRYTPNSHLPGVDPSAAMSSASIGIQLAVMRRPAESIPNKERAIQLEPEYAPPYYHLGVLLWLDQDADKDIQLLKRAATLGPNVFDYRYQLGISLHAVDHTAEAIRELKAATKLKPGDANAWLSLSFTRKIGSFAGSPESLREGR